MSQHGHDQNGPRRGSGAPSKKRQALIFGRTFLKNPRMLGALLPSSRYLVRRMLRPVDWSRADVVVEYGPGVGTFTEEILRRMRPGTRLIAFETQPDFVGHLRTSFADPRLEVVHGSAEEVEEALRERALDSADYVLSGIPFSLMPEDLRDRILERTRSVLEPDGVALIYQYSPSIRSSLERAFGEVEWEFEPRNLFPALVFECRP